MKVAVLEYLSGGGLQNDVNSSSLFNEGLAMLTALATDLALCGHKVHTCASVAFRSAKEAEAAALAQAAAFAERKATLTVHPIDPDNDKHSWMDRWIEVALQCDRTIVIAPEIHQQLEDIVAKLRLSGATVVASSGAFLKAASDKLATANFFKKSQVPHPATLSLSRYLTSIDKLDDSKPASAVTLKRRDGAGCVDMKVFANQRRLTEWLEDQESQKVFGDEWIVQEWLSGKSASVALLAGDDWTLLGAVHQRIELANSLNQLGVFEVSYLGGTGPVSGVSVEQLENLASQVREALPPGAAGWIGIDFLVPDESVGSKDLIAIEVNPRLTTSYLGYRKWYGYTLADSLLGNVSHSDLKLGMNQQRIEFDVS